MHPYLRTKTLFEAQLTEPPAPDLGIIVVIPAYDETEVVSTLQAIKNCQLPEGAVEVLIVFNDSEKDSEEIKNTNRREFQKVSDWSNQNSTQRLRYYPLHFSGLPAKHAGVGLARKIGMDEACRRFSHNSVENGVIVGFDADSLCEENYLLAIEDHFATQPEIAAASLHFEHPLEGKKFQEGTYSAIARYELHLRYYIHAQRYAGFPFAFQTIGSSMAVRYGDYMRQGGMNKRKAGEDFYFLHKFIALGNFTELKTTTVIPSPRMSGRVPFGTGKAVAAILSDKELGYKTYSPESIECLKPFFDSIGSLYKASGVRLSNIWNHWPGPIKGYLDRERFFEILDEIKGNTASESAFSKRFYRWFNAFQVMKYLHHARDHFYPDVPVEEGAGWLLGKLVKRDVNGLDAKGASGNFSTNRQNLKR